MFSACLWVVNFLVQLKNVLQTFGQSTVKHTQQHISKAQFCVAYLNINLSVFIDVTF